MVQGHAEPEILALDRTINQRGIVFDTELARALIEREAQEAADATRDLERLTEGAIQANHLRSPQHLLTWLRARDVQLPNLRRDTVQQVLENAPALDPVVRQVLAARLVTSRVTAAKLESALAAAHDDGRLRDLLVYHKAHTGRWAGRGVQPHNLPRPHDALQDLGPLLAAAHDHATFRQALPPGVSLADALSALIRPCFRAGPGMVLCIADYASVEARGVAWCAGEGGLLDLFAQGGDTYCDFASHVFGRPVTKAMKAERKIGKEAVLGCGYSMVRACSASGARRRGLTSGRPGSRPRRWWSGTGTPTRPSPAPR